MTADGIRAIRQAMDELTGPMRGLEGAVARLDLMVGTLNGEDDARGLMVPSLMTEVQRQASEVCLAAAMVYQTAKRESGVGRRRWP